MSVNTFDPRVCPCCGQTTTSGLTTYYSWRKANWQWRCWQCDAKALDRFFAIGIASIIAAAALLCVLIGRWR